MIPADQGKPLEEGSMASVIGNFAALFGCFDVALPPLHMQVEELFYRSGS